MNVDLSNMSSGVYWVEVVDSNGHHCRDSIFINHSVVPVLKFNTNPDPPKICKGGKIIIEASSGFKEYSWSNKMHGSRIEFYPEKTMELNLDAITESGCAARKSLKITVDSCAQDIESQSDQSIKIYPNPVIDNVLYISSNEIKINGIQILDMTGRVINTVISKNSDRAEIQLINCRKGILLIRIFTDKAVINKIISVE